MTARISFNKPTGQQIHFNSNSQGQTQPSSLFYPTNGIPANNELRPARFTTGSGSFPTEYQVPQRQTVAIERERVEVKQIERPQFEKVYNAGYPNKKLGPQEDPAQKSSCCHPGCWAIAAILALAAITLALLFGLGVIGGNIDNSNSNSNSNSVSPIIISNAAANATNPTTGKTTTSTTTTTTNTGTTTPSGVTGVSTTGGSTSTSGTSSTSTTGSTTTNTGTTSSTTSGTSTAAKTSSNGVIPASISPITVPTSA